MDEKQMEMSDSDGGCIPIDTNGDGCCDASDIETTEQSLTTDATDELVCTTLDIPATMEGGCFDTQDGYSLDQFNVDHKETNVCGELHGSELEQQRQANELTSSAIIANETPKCNRCTLLENNNENNGNNDSISLSTLISTIMKGTASNVGNGGQMSSPSLKTDGKRDENEDSEIIPTQPTDNDISAGKEKHSCGESQTPQSCQGEPRKANRGDESRETGGILPHTLSSIRRGRAREPLTMATSRDGNLSREIPETETIHTDKGSFFRCVSCKVSFQFEQDMRMHLLTHLRTRYFCPVCSRRFLNQSTMERHLMTHNDLKPYVCSVCSQGFRIKSNLHRHYERLHTKKSEGSSRRGRARARAPLQQTASFPSDELNNQTCSYAITTMSENIPYGPPLYPANAHEMQHDTAAANDTRSHHRSVGSITLGQQSIESIGSGADQPPEYCDVKTFKTPSSAFKTSSSGISNHEPISSHSTKLLTGQTDIKSLPSSIPRVEGVVDSIRRIETERLFHRELLLEELRLRKKYGLRTEDAIGAIESDTANLQRFDTFADTFVSQTNSVEKLWDNTTRARSDVTSHLNEYALHPSLSPNYHGSHSHIIDNSLESKGGSVERYGPFQPDSVSMASTGKGDKATNLLSTSELRQIMSYNQISSNQPHPRNSSRNRATHETTNDGQSTYEEDNEEFIPSTQDQTIQQYAGHLCRNPFQVNGPRISRKRRASMPLTTPAEPSFQETNSRYPFVHDRPAVHSGEHATFTTFPPVAMRRKIPRVFANDEHNPASLQSPELMPSLLLRRHQNHHQVQFPQNSIPPHSSRSLMRRTSWAQDMSYHLPVREVEQPNSIRYKPVKFQMTPKSLTYGGGQPNDFNRGGSEELKGEAIIRRTSTALSYSQPSSLIDFSTEQASFQAHSPSFVVTGPVTTRRQSLQAEGNDQSQSRDSPLDLSKKPL